MPAQPETAVPEGPVRIEVTAEDLGTGERQSVVITDDYVLIYAGSCYQASVEADIARGVHVIHGQGSEAEVTGARPEPVLHRHADHDTALICRPALGCGLCEMIGSVEPEYFAPARFVLTVLHRKGDPPGHPAELATAEPVDGWTVCGRAMLQSESWVAIGFRDGDSVCDGCSLPGDPLAVAPDEAEATLW